MPLTEQELLLHRFVDQELAPAERVMFFEALDGDPVLRRRLLEIERLAIRASRLPRHEPPSGFTARVLSRLSAPPAGWLARLRTWFVPFPVVSWRLARVAALACGFFVVGVASGWFLYQPTPRPVSGPTADAGSTVYVRFVLLQPQAESVTVAGDFNGWDPQRTPLRRSGSGLWTLTMPLKPGRYHYMYVVDGRQWMADPFAPELSADGFGAENAVLDVGISCERTAGQDVPARQRLRWPLLLGYTMLAACAVAQPIERAKADKKPVRFTMVAPTAHAVAVVGSFNGWSVGTHAMDEVGRGGRWSLELLLPAGEYRFMYVIDGQRWVTPPEADDFVQDGFGQLNGVLVVP